MITNSKFRFKGLAITLAIFVGVGCGKKKDEDDDDTEANTPAAVGIGQSTTSDSSVDVPQAGAISLSSLGQAEGASLTEGEGECSQEGLMGIPFGMACHTSPFAAKLLLGSIDGDHDGDGTTNCADYTHAEANDEEGGILLALMCEDLFTSTDNVVSFAWDDTDSGDSIAVSFADFENDTEAVGNWTKGDSASYPADVRLWGGESLTAAAARVGMGLTSATQGTIWVPQFGADGDEEHLPFDIKVSFNNIDDASGCEAAPSADTCLNHNIKLFGDDATASDAPPNGVHLQVYADGLAEPTFIAVEGKLRLSEERAEEAWQDHPAIQDTREIYFQAVQKGDQVWGHFQFLDENGDVITSELPFIGDMLEQLADSTGVCQDRGSEDFVACEDIDPTDYTDLWAGKTDFESITASVIDVDFGASPTPAGMCTTIGCYEF